MLEFVFKPDPFKNDPIDITDLDVSDSSDIDKKEQSLNWSRKCPKQLIHSTVLV